MRTFQSTYKSSVSYYPNNPWELTNGGRAEAKRVLHAQSESDESEIQYLLEYYSLVRDGKTNYISTTAFHDVTGSHPQEPPGFFKTYAEQFGPKNASKKRKLR